jgi:hypothetical protein
MVAGTAVASPNGRPVLPQVSRMPPVSPAARDVSGSVLRVDVPNRELTVQVDGRTIDLDVPLGCTVVLNGQPVRLRLVQPQDRVRVRYDAGPSRGVAVQIDVNP